MKKFITLALALVLTFSMAVCAFAAEATLDDTNGLTKDIAVNGQYVAVDSVDVVSVTLAWTDVTWTYTVTGGTWDPSTHAYSADTGVWSGDDLVITATNDSNCDVTVTFALDENLAKFATLDLTEAQTLDDYETNNVADTVTATISLNTATTETIEADGTLGNVTVTVAKA